MKVIDRTRKIPKPQHDFHYRIILARPCVSSGYRSMGYQKRMPLPEPKVVTVKGLGRAKAEAMYYAAHYKRHRVSVLNNVGDTVLEYDSTAI